MEVIYCMCPEGY